MEELRQIREQEQKRRDDLNQFGTLKMLWSTLPGEVTDLDLGNGIQVSRRPEQRDNRQSWNLQRVDQHLRRVAQKVGRSYTLKFQTDLAYDPNIHTLFEAFARLTLEDVKACLTYAQELVEAERPKLTHVHV